MDPLNPITPGTTPIPSRRVPSIERLPRITREGDRPGREPSERRRREPPPESGGPSGGEDEGAGPHIDVRV